MSKKEKIPVDIERISRIFGKIIKVLQKKTKSPVEALIVLKFGVAYLENRLGVKAADDSEIRVFIEEAMKEEKKAYFETA